MYASSGTLAGKQGWISKDDKQDLRDLHRVNQLHDYDMEK